MKGLERRHHVDEVCSSGLVVGIRPSSCDLMRSTDVHAHRITPTEERLVKDVIDARRHREEHWLSATDATKTLESVVRSLSLPAGEGFVWACGEYHDIKAIRQYVLDELGISKQRLSAMAYWRKSQANAHDHFDED